VNTEDIVELQGQAWSLQAEGKLSDAAEACQRALRLLAQAGDDNTPDAANLLNDLAEIECDRQNFKTALEIVQRAYEIENVLGHQLTGDIAAQLRSRTLGMIGQIHRTNGDYALAEPSLQEALQIVATEFGEDSAEVADARNNLAVLYKYWGRFDQGLELYEQVLQSIIVRRGDTCLEAAAVYHNIGGILHSKGDFAAAEPPARKAWDISRRLLGEDDPRAQLDAVAYAAVLDGLGRFRECEVIYRHALTIFAATLGPEGYEVAANLHNLAAALSAQGKNEEAEHLYRSSLALQERLLGEHNPDVALTCNNLGSLLNSQGRYGEAVDLLRRSVHILQDRLPPGHPHLDRARANLDIAENDARFGGKTEQVHRCLVLGPANSIKPTVVKL
jgi:tetratricopeptide (TPR) repeat protein